MGLRFRKSINLGGGFRINLSKSGVGYSFGGKGFRFTRTAKGRNRTTISLPGTGLSWTSESRGKHSKTSKHTEQSAPEPNDLTYLYSVDSANASDLTSSELTDFIRSIKISYRIQTLLMIAALLTFCFARAGEGIAARVICWALFAVAVVLWVLHFIYGRTKAEYEFDDYARQKYELQLQAFEALRKNKKLWQLREVFSNAHKKVHGGADYSIKRLPIKVRKRKPLFLNTNADCYCIRLQKEKLYILPDNIIVKGRKGFGAISFADLNITTDTDLVIENTAPRDAQVVKHTWRYVNKNGTADKRFSNNRQLPVCRYATVTLQSSTGLNAVLYLSNHLTGKEFEDLMKQAKEN